MEKGLNIDPRSLPWQHSEDISLTKVPVSEIREYLQFLKQQGW